MWDNSIKLLFMIDNRQSIPLTLGIDTLQTAYRLQHARVNERNKRWCNFAFHFAEVSCDLDDDDDDGRK